MDAGVTARAEARSTVSALAVGLALTVACFPDAVFGGGIFIGRDMLRVYYPLHAYWAVRVAGGEFPRRPTDVGVREGPSSGVELSRFAAAGPSSSTTD